MKLTKRQTVNIREGHARKASGLLARLEENADGRLCNNNKDPIEMTSGQIKSAEIFLKKVLPDLQSIDSLQVSQHDHTLRRSHYRRGSPGGS